MANGYKTGGRRKGTPNKDNPLKSYLRSHSTAYYEPSVIVEDELTAKTLGVSVGDVVSRFDADLAMMTPGDRAALEEKLLRYHTPQMQSVSAEVKVSTATPLEVRLSQLAAESDTSPDITTDPSAQYKKRPHQ